MDVTKLSNDGLMFYYFNNRNQIDQLYRQQKELEQEINKRLAIMREQGARGKFSVQNGDKSWKELI